MTRDRFVRTREHAPVCTRVCSSKRNFALLLALCGFVGLDVACEPDAKPLRDPLCAKHPPPRDPWAISLGLLGPYFFDATSGRCVEYNNPAPADLKAAGYESWDEFYKSYVPFKSVEECVARCYEPESCDAETPCQLFELPCAMPPCITFAQTCVWVSSEGRGYCAPQCQPQGIDTPHEHLGWLSGAICPDGLVCSSVAPGNCYPCQEYAEACVVPE